MLGTGKIHLYYGDGKGKTTAAVGQVVGRRAQDFACWCSSS